MALLLAPAHAQEILSEQTQPPSTVMLILLDDTLTNINRGDNSATSLSTTFDNVPVARLATDPQDARGQAVVRMLTHLQADESVTHRVAVLRFATTGETPQWLTGTDEAPFITLGTGDATSEVFTATASRILGRANYRVVGPGDTVLALDTSLEHLGNEIRNSVNLNIKPIITLITDDVPIKTWALSPWRVSDTSSGPDNWDDYVAGFSNTLDRLAQAAPYNGYCEAETGITLGVFALGSANWVNADGTIAPYDGTINADGITPGNGDYFPSLLEGLGLTNYVYAIDPGFVDATGSVLKENLLEQTDSFITDVRCLAPLDILPERDPFSTTFSFDVSTFHKQLLIAIEDPTGGIPPDLQVNLANMTPAPTKFVRYRDDAPYTIMVVNHDDIPENWTGTWQIVTDPDIAIDLNIYASLDYSGIEIIPQTILDNVVRGERFSYEVLVQDRYQQPIANDPLLDNVSLVVNGVPGLMNFESERQIYNRSVLGDEVATTGTIDIAAMVNVRVPDGHTDLVPLTFPLTSIQSSSQLNLGNPPSVGTLPCNDGTYQLSVPIDFDTNSNLDSITSYMRVEAKYRNQPTPIAILTWDFDTKFVGTIHCENLESGDDQTIIIEGVLPDGGRQRIDFIFDYYAPTPTPAPTVNPLPTATAVPPHPRYIDNIRDSIFSFPLNILLSIIGVGFVSAIVIASWQVYHRYVTPLHDVYLTEHIDTKETPRTPLIRGFARWLPFFQSRTFYLSMPDNNNASKVRSVPLFSVQGKQGGQALKIKVMAQNVRVNGINPPLNTVQEYSAREVTVNYEGVMGVHIYRIINNYAR